MNFRRVAVLPYRAWIAKVPDPTLNRYLSNAWNWLAAVAAIAMIAVCWPVLAELTDIPAYLLPAFALLGCGGIAVVFFGEHAVRIGWAATVVTAGVASLIPNSADWPMPPPLFLALLAMTVAALCTQPLNRLPVVAIATAGAFVLGIGPDARIGWIFGLAVATISIAFVRYRASSRREIAEQTEATEVLRAREAVLAERSRIARDLHDIVAHRMSMIVVMSQTAPYRLAAADPAEEVGPGARTEFDGIADAARESLDEVRQLLGVLRPHGDEPAALRPVQGLGDLPELIDGVRTAGVDVHLDDTVDHGTVSPTVGTAAFRIVQESVTNATRHAPGASVAVSLRLDPDDHRRLALEIRNSPAAKALGGDSPHGGHGILGMTERALAVGGSLSAGPLPDGGFLVSAALPLALG
ncbi:sensor histidine kinase [Gordonia sp. (in: high G+C Gram-positive bacteria)]|uniref:sensor histidine kinase n=1 Tax=Gordonia sp. (in: high G+C Gram-positive bacteria) TaxID=84139 RepID=UPI0025C17E09|nr:sensor histidine kinase [Gordonia sp. (in: high G+C Gram-positive bacteria)]